MWSVLQRASSADPVVSGRWAAGTLLCDALLCVLIVMRVPFGNIDWETYMAQVDVVLSGSADYAEIQGPTGPIAYPCGHVYFYGLLRWLRVSVLSAQVVFAGLYLATLWLVLQLYRRAGAPGWLLVLCMASKRVHSVFMLRCFNDGVATFLLYLSLTLLLRHKSFAAALVYSLSVSVKMHTLFYAPAFGLCLVFQGGWRLALQLVGLMAMTQVVLAAPFLSTNAGAYLSRAFGGPGDLQQEWSVNWRMLPESAFYHKGFPQLLGLCTIILLLWFAQCRWVPLARGLVDPRLWQWSSQKHLDDRSMLAILFSCNFVVIVCLRTMHFQFIVWYFHTIPFLAWYSIRPDRHTGFAWACRCAMVACLTMCAEIPFLITTSGQVRGPDGRRWETIGLPTPAGSWLLLAAHAVLLGLLMCGERVQEVKEVKED